MCLLLVVFTACNGDALPKSNVEYNEAYEIISQAFKKMGEATSFNMSFESKSDAAFEEFSSTEKSNYSLNVSGLGTNELIAVAQKQNTESRTITRYFFEKDRFYSIEEENEQFSMPYLYISDEIDVMAEVTGLNAFAIDIEAVNSALQKSKSIVKTTENNVVSVRFSLQSEDLVDIIGDSFEVFENLENFSGFMSFEIDSQGYIVGFGYDSSFKETYAEESQSYVDLNVKFKFSDINKAQNITKPDWASQLGATDYDSVKYVKNKVEYFFLCESPEKGDDYFYKLYEVSNLDDAEQPVKLADIPSSIEGVPVMGISGTAIAFGKGVEVLVLPETVTEVPYPENNTPMTVFCKCTELTEVPPEDVTVYLADEWEYKDGIPTVKVTEEE